MIEFLILCSNGFTVANTWPLIYQGFSYKRKLDANWSIRVLANGKTKRAISDLQVKLLERNELKGLISIRCGCNSVHYQLVLCEKTALVFILNDDMSSNKLWCISAWPEHMELSFRRATRGKFLLDTRMPIVREVLDIEWDSDSMIEDLSFVSRSLKTVTIDWKYNVRWNAFVRS